MKSTELKKLIKNAVKEAIQEELKDILLEAVKAPKAPLITESKNMDVPQKFQPQGSTDTTSANGQLPGGDVGMDQIMNLMTGK